MSLPVCGTCGHPLGLSAADRCQHQPLPPVQPIVLMDEPTDPLDELIEDCLAEFVEFTDTELDRVLPCSQPVAALIAEYV